MFKLFSSISDQEKDISTEGIGLGLVICKKIAEQFRGEIKFKSRYGAGSTFDFSFEAELVDLEKGESMEMDSTIVENMEYDDKQSYDGQPLRLENRSLTFMGAYSVIAKYKDKRILVADDEEFCISTMKILLKKAGVDINFQVDYCLSGQEALEAVVESYEHG